MFHRDDICSAVSIRGARETQEAYPRRALPAASPHAGASFPARYSTRTKVVPEPTGSMPASSMPAGSMPAGSWVADGWMASQSDAGRRRAAPIDRFVPDTERKDKSRKGRKEGRKEGRVGGAEGRWRVSGGGVDWRQCEASVRGGGGLE